MAIISMAPEFLPSEVSELCLGRSRWKSSVVGPCSSGRKTPGLASARLQKRRVWPCKGQVKGARSQTGRSWHVNPRWKHPLHFLPERFRPLVVRLDTRLCRFFPCRRIL